MATSIEPLHCGTLRSTMSMFEAGGGDDHITIPVPSWLIRHAEGTVVVDCGMHSDLSHEGESLDMLSPFFEVGLSQEQLIAGALAARDVDAAEVDVVILTHLHFDHAGGLEQLPNARVVVQRDEWAAGGGDLEALNGFTPSDYQLGHDVVQVDGEHDLFGDGAVSCMPTPGHTAGHQSVRVRLAEQEVVLCGDCAYFERTLNGAPLPALGSDLEQQARSVEWLVERRRAGALVIPGHDPEVFANLPERIV